MEAVFYYIFTIYLLSAVHAGSWSGWMEWTPCSRTCDGGVSYQLRRCLARPCSGVNIRYRLCNIQPCPAGGSIDFRTVQCAAYNDAPYRGQVYQWEGVYESRDPCSLRCRAIGPGFVVMLAQKVIDGTRCSQHSKDMCIDGKCWMVGCDYVINSEKREDECGVCGGNGSSCLQRAHARQTAQQSTYGWEETGFNNCSGTCGVGQQVMTIACKNITSGQNVGHHNCNAGKRPREKRRECEKRSCRRVWVKGKWSRCSRTCGEGVITRAIFCVEEMPNGTYQRSREHLCSSSRPAIQRNCINMACIAWRAVHWSSCSVTCGEGVQSREVRCSSTNQQDCSRLPQPITSRICDTNVTCDQRQVILTRNSLTEETNEKHPSPSGHLNSTAYSNTSHTDNETDNRKTQQEEIDESKSTSGETRFRSAPDVTYERQLRLETHARVRQPDLPRRAEEESAGSSDWHSSEEWASGEVLFPFYQGSLGKAESNADNEREQVITSTPTFVVSSWSSCSETCGRGTRSRRVQCKMFHELTNNIQDLPENTCRGPRPSQQEECMVEPCESEEADGQYTWRLAGYGSCSASCLGGSEEPLFACIRQLDNTKVGEDFCVGLPEPAAPVRECNHNPCPPRWRTYPYGPCSAQCGGGLHRRRVECIQEHGLGPNNIIIMPDAFCTDAMPSRTMPCNLADCPASWTTSTWSKCSSTCGTGLQTRDVICERVVSPGRVIAVNATYCEDETPPSEKRCESAPCPTKPPAKISRIITDPSTYMQLRKKKKIRLPVGGTLHVISGISVTILCQVVKFDRRTIYWTRQNKTIPRKGRIKVSRNGALNMRRIRLSDSDTFVCHAGDMTANSTLLFHSREEADMKYSHRIKWLASNHNYFSDLNLTLKSKKSSRRNEVTLNTVLKTRNITSIPFSYVTEDWQLCSKTCGGAGLQMRDITCELIFEDHYLVVNDYFCDANGHVKPLETRDCGYHKCPVWQVGRWSECQDQICLKHDVGTRRRSLYCVSHNNSLVKPSMCGLDSKPNELHYCQHKECRASWKVSKWSKCSRSCGQKGLRTRALQCVWVNSKKPAGINCRGMSRPTLGKPCFPPPCTPAACRDKSKFCSLVLMMHLCRYAAYQRECCSACSYRQHLPYGQRH